MSDFKGMRILVTGGAGFIGSHVVDAYLERGAEVTVVDDLSSGLEANVASGAELVEGDLRDERLVRELLSSQSFDLVNHHAAQIDVRRSVADPAWDAELNIVASLRLLEHCAAHGVRRFIFASSGGAIYGDPEFTPQTEEHPVAPISPYGCAKLAVEHYLHYYAAVQGLETVALRYANVYGPRQRKDGEAGVVAIFAGRLLENEPVVINGDGEQTRDYVLVGDVIRANVSVVEHDLTGAYNVGTGIETSVNGLCDAIVQSVGTTGRITHGPAKPGEQRRSVLDGSKLSRAAALDPFVPLSEGLETTVRWFREHGT